MTLEDTNNIKAHIEPVKVQQSLKKSSPQKAKDAVSSPATSVEDKKVEKKAVESRNKTVRENNNFQISSDSETKSNAITKSQLLEITEGINKELSFFASSVQFKIEEVEEQPGSSRIAGNGKEGEILHTKKKEIVVSVVDKRTGEVIRQIPPEDLLQSLTNASMFLGLLVDQIV
ncbi:MAG: flagellar protein FlaG [Candidatus Aureabacteria bacterium]|nr:flagellar protein FlaG [Candidatus Auribacterota bacterium]